MDRLFDCISYISELLRDGILDMFCCFYNLIANDQMDMDVEKGQTQPLIITEPTTVKPPIALVPATPSTPDSTADLRISHPNCQQDTSITLEFCVSPTITPSFNLESATTLHSPQDIIDLTNRNRLSS